MPTRAAAYAGRLRLRELAFEKLADYDGWRQRGRQAVRQALDRGDFLLWLAGNHLGALPLYDELSSLGDRCLVVQFDAHLDIHNFADCTPELSHGNFLLHCAGPLPPVVNVGHRELLLRPEYVARHYRLALPAEALALDPAAVLAELREASAAAERVFIDIDCDVLDPAFFPAVGQPVPFGLTPQQLLRCLDAVWSERVAGVAVSEFDPARDRDDRRWRPWSGCWSACCCGVTRGERRLPIRDETPIRMATGVTLRPGPPRRDDEIMGIVKDCWSG